MVCFEIPLAWISMQCIYLQLKLAILFAFGEFCTATLTASSKVW